MFASYRRAATLFDVLATLACFAVLLSVMSLAFGQQPTAHGSAPAGSHRLTLKDQAQIRGIHQSLIIFANENKGVFLRPGLIDRLASPENGNRETPGRGPEDIAANTSAMMYSNLLMQNFVTPELLVSPVERSTRVTVKADYAYDKYSPPNDVYWDDTFKADLADVSNASYAHVPLCGKRMDEGWRSTLNAKYASMGNRGPKDGEIDPKSWTCGPHGHWAGNIGFNDNHVEFLTATRVPVVAEGEGKADSDNLFAVEDGPLGGDMVITFTKVMAEAGAEIQFD